MLCKKKSKGINAKTAEARARKVAVQAEREKRQALELTEAAWVASCPTPLKPSKAARRKEETLARRSEALAKKAEIEKLAAQEQQMLETLYHTGRKERKCALYSSRPHTDHDVLVTCSTADQSTYNHSKKGAVSPRQSRIVGTQEHMQLLDSAVCNDDHLGFLDTAPAHLYATRRPSIPIRPHLRSRKTLYQASFVCVDA